MSEVPQFSGGWGGEADGAQGPPRRGQGRRDRPSPLLLAYLKLSDPLWLLRSKDAAHVDLMVAILFLIRLLMRRVCLLLLLLLLLYYSHA